MKSKSFKIGKVALVGRPNTGKSTLLNTIVGQKISIVTPKAQTTQSRITAFFENEQGQIFFTDTPGLLNSKLALKKTKSLISGTIRDAQVIAYVIDHTRAFGPEEVVILELVLKSKKPFIAIFNKSDISYPSFKELYLERLGTLPQDILEVSALKNKGINGVITALLKLLPEGKRDKSVDEKVSPLLSFTSEQYLEELIREKIFLSTKQEVPYQTTTHILSVINNDQRNLIKIKGSIQVSEEKYKPILIGKDGSKIKEISLAVRKEMELLTNKKVYIELVVKV